MHAWRAILVVAVFPIAWLAGVLVICLTHANGAVGTVVAVVWGSVCYTVALTVAGRSLNWARGPRSIIYVIGYVIGALAAFAGMVFGSAYLVRAYQWFTWNPIGEVSDNGWGWYRCEANDMQTVGNGSDFVAVVRRTECPGFMAGDEDLSYYVFVHVAQQPTTAHDLVFRYETTDAGWDAPPYIAWTGTHSLTIAVGRGDILQITKQEPTSGEIRIEYALAAPVLPSATEYWERPFW